MPRKLNNYSEEDVNFALNEIEKGASVKASSLKYKIPRMTLTRRFKGIGKHSCGPETVLSKEEENLQENWIISCAKRGYPKRKMDLLLSVKELVLLDNRKTNFKDDMPGEGWYRGFLRRHPKISRRTPEAVTHASASITEKDIRGWFLNVEKCLKDDNFFDVLSCPSRVFNGDESRFLLNPGSSSSALALKGSKNVYEIDAGLAKFSITAMFTISDTGMVVPPRFFYLYKRIPMNICHSVNPDWGIGRSDSRWMRGEVFYEYIGNIFIPFLVKNNIERPVILFLDGHKSHLTMQLSELCNDQGIVLVSLYPNCTRILQPTDASTFRPLKELYRQEVAQWKTCHHGRDVTKKDFAPILEGALNKLSPAAVKNGFRACGLCPWNPNAMNYEKCLGSSQNKQYAEESEQEEKLNTVINKMEFEQFVGDELLNKIKSDEDYQSLNEAEKALKRIWRHLRSENTDLLESENVEGLQRSEETLKENEPTPQSNEEILEKNKEMPKQVSSHEVFNSRRRPFISNSEASALGNEETLKENEPTPQSNEEILEKNKEMPKQVSSHEVFNSRRRPFTSNSEASALGSILDWPESPRREGNRNIPRNPFVTSGRQWQTCYLEKENKKKEELRTKEEKQLLQRKRKAEAEEKKAQKKSSTKGKKSVVCIGLCFQCNSNIKENGLKCSQCPKLFHTRCLPKKI